MEHFLSRLAVVLYVMIGLMAGSVSAAEENSVLSQYLPKVSPDTLVAGADAYGPIRSDVPVAPLLQGGKEIGYVYVTSDFVGTTGYSGKPIHTMVAVDQNAVILGVDLVKHSEPIVLIGIPDSKIKAMVAEFRGVNLVDEAKSGGESHDLDIISGATVTVMVIDDSIIRSGIKVARALGLGGMKAEVHTGPKYEIVTDALVPDRWSEMVGDGAVRRLSLDVAQINATFAAMNDPRTEKHTLKESPDTTFIDLDTALVSAAPIGEALLGESGYADLQNWLPPGDQAILVLGRGLYSFKGSGYVRGGIFDRIVLVQDDISVRFRDKMHKRVGQIALPDAPEFKERDLFKIPADSRFDPTRPFRLQLLVQRSVGAMDKVFTTFELDYRLPDAYLRPIVAPATATDVQQLMQDESEEQAQSNLWRKIWEDKSVEVVVLGAMLAILTLGFFFQMHLTRSNKRVRIFRYAFLTLTLVFLGWYANAQLSVVNLMALFGALTTDFSWQAFLLDPLTFILWFSVAASLLFWGRGAYCGWLCPFGALQELTNHIARALKVPQVKLPWGLHERLWALKYMIFLGLFGVSLALIEQAEHLAEIEPFKTAIVLKFVRAWPFVCYAAALLIAGLFVERFYCRYLCPLGAALAIPARMRMFDWLKRYKECGSPCQTCANECMVQAIHPTGEINPNECLNCMHCQVLYQSEDKCPVVIRQLKRRAAVSQPDRPSAQAKAVSNHPNLAHKKEAQDV